MSISGLLSIFFPHLAGLRITRVFATGRSVRIQASTCVPQAPCPACGVHARRVHGRYERRICDTAVSGRELVIHLGVRRFFCGNEACLKKIFSEQVPGLTVHYGRRSIGLAQTLRAVALALGGRAGARLSGRLAAVVSRMTLLRIIRAMPDPALGGPVRVLGVDDFALRRGHVYGTVLIDITTSRPVDVLPDRSADALATWLTAHPGVEVICRDRAGSYSDGAARGAPEAIQVADRFHLWKNLGEAVERVVAKHRTCLTAAAITPSTTAPTPAVSSEPAAARTGRLAERTRERHAAIHALLAQHASLHEVAAQLGVSRNTVRRFARATSAEELLVNDGTGRRTELLDPHADYLRRRRSQGCSDAAHLWEELRERGYRGSYASVRDYVRPFRAHGTPPARAPAKVRQFTGWIMRNPANLDAEDTGRLNAVLADCPELSALRGHVRDRTVPGRSKATSTASK